MVEGQPRGVFTGIMQRMRKWELWGYADGWMNSENVPHDRKLRRAIVAGYVPRLIKVMRSIEKADIEDTHIWIREQRKKRHPLSVAWWSWRVNKYEKRVKRLQRLDKGILEEYAQKRPKLEKKPQGQIAIKRGEEGVEAGVYLHFFVKPDYYGKFMEK